MREEADEAMDIRPEYVLGKILKEMASKKMRSPIKQIVIPTKKAN